MKKKKKSQPKQADSAYHADPAYHFGQALGFLLLLGALESCLKDTETQKPSVSEKGDLKA